MSTPDTDTLQAIDAYLNDNEARFLDELFEFLRIPSVSTDPENAADVRRCAEWLIEHLQGIGLSTVELHETPGHPIVYAEHLGKEGAPTLLVYGHYDVQPPDPLELWTTPPFEPQVREGKIFARGATDDKGQVFCHIKGLEAWLQTVGELPINVKLLIEGEEEVGSVNLDHWIAAHKERLSCDAVVISDSSMFAPGIPSITYGLRGLAYLEMTVEGPDHDLHSGLFGGAIPNPINEIAGIIARLHDDKGQVAIPGFYDDVIALSDEERADFAALPFDEAGFLEESGAAALRGESGYTTLERIWARPTLDCNGIWGGFTGVGAKTVLPAKAHAKFSCRLVPGQDPERVAEQAEAFVREIAHPSVRVTVTPHHGGKPVLTERDAPAVQAATRALSRVWGKEAVFTRGGGSIPVVATFSDILKAPTVLMGLGLEDDRLHSPDEKFNLENFYAGVRASAYLWDESQS
ncbi:dipeptidase [Lujinxingia litoralis]|uniref:dipeptidase n=1 Tax=Lujinxingia litoralis TaxID=2211119 RepID=UPI0018F390DD|nr:dipeptidase [Lujinxingia litoralis]